MRVAAPLRSPDSQFGSGGLSGGSPPSGITHAPPSGIAPAVDTKPKIQAFEQKMSAGHSESNWKRSPTASGTGACHVKSFHAKLTGESLEFLDKQINEWLDAHPQYEVKLVTSTVGEWTGKLKEPNLIVQVWV